MKQQKLTVVLKCRAEKELSDRLRELSAQRRIKYQAAMRAALWAYVDAADAAEVEVRARLRAQASAPSRQSRARLISRATSSKA